MFGRLGKDAGSLLGIDISCCAVRLLQLRQVAGAFEVRAQAVQTLAAGVLQDGRVADPAQLAQVLGDALARSGATLREAALAIPAAAVLSKTVQVPAGLAEDALIARLCHEAEPFIPFALDEAAFDFECRGSVAHDPCYEAVGVYACHQGWLDGLEAALELAGLRARVVETDSLALLRAVGADDDAVAVVRVEPGHWALHAQHQAWRADAGAAADVPQALAACIERWLQALEGPAPARLVLTGAAADSARALEVQRRLGIETTVFDAAEPALALAYGLAMRRAP